MEHPHQARQHKEPNLDTKDGKRSSTSVNAQQIFKAEVDAKTRLSSERCNITGPANLIKKSILKSRRHQRKSVTKLFNRLFSRLAKLLCNKKLPTQ